MGNRRVFFVLCCSIIYNLSTCQPARNPDECDFDLTVIKHSPCSRRSGPATEVISFPSGLGQKPLRGSDCSCFHVDVGNLHIDYPGLNVSNIFVHVTMRIGGPLSDPVRCLGADKYGCGGVGSCVYCNVCQAAKRQRDVFRINQQQLNLNCQRILDPGTYGNVTFSICPQKNELLNLLSDDEEEGRQLWEEIGQKKGVRFVLMARMFNEPIQQLDSEQMIEVNWVTKKGMIGCHWIIGYLK